MSMSRIKLAARTLLVATLAAYPTALTAQDFRIDTEIFVGLESEKKEKEPAAETLTIFTNGMVYDFLLSDTREMTLFDPSRGRFTLLDESRRVKASLSTQEVLDYVFAFETYAAQSKDSLFAFAAKPEF